MAPDLLEGLIVIEAHRRNFSKHTMNNSNIAKNSASALQAALERELRAYRARNYAIAIGLEPKSDSELRFRRLELLRSGSSFGRFLKIRKDISRR
jgi:hypothetical protein